MENAEMVCRLLMMCVCVAMKSLKIGIVELVKKTLPESVCVCVDIHVKILHVYMKYQLIYFSLHWLGSACYAGSSCGLIDACLSVFTLLFSP